ncbi:MAG: aminopeptidase P family protein [Chloroflexota bacterium]|nr:aminopeptidase P family protein [Chloroflexota bacterium]
MVDYISRIQHLRDSLANENLQGAIISQPENRRYISGFTGSSGLCIISEKNALLSTDSRYTEQAAKQSPEFSIFQTIGNFDKWLPNVLDNLPRGSNLGIEFEHVTHGTFNRFKAVADDMNITLKPMNGILEKQRNIKDEDEKQWLKKAIEITDASIEKLMGTIHTGMTEKDVSWEIEQNMRNLGAEGIAFDLIVASGPNGAMAHHFPSDQKIEAGVPIVIDIGAKFNGYHADLTRSFTLGKPDKRFNEIFDIVLTAQETAIATIQSGITGEKADSLARAIIEDAGFGENFGHSLGHGVGLAVHEYPRLAQSAEEILEDGMIFTVEPGIYLSGWGGIRIEDVVELKDGRCWPLSQASKIREV